MQTLPYINIVHLIIRNKTFAPIHKQYNDMNYQCITVLLLCYLYSKLVKDQFAITNISVFMGYYNTKQIKYYFDIMIRLGLITLAGLNKYKLTDLGLSVIRQVNDNYDLALYNFCQKYNITL